jgi:hypothetical protein
MFTKSFAPRNAFPCATSLKPMRAATTASQLPSTKSSGSSVESSKTPISIVSVRRNFQRDCMRLRISVAVVSAKTSGRQYSGFLSSSTNVQYTSPSEHPSLSRSPIFSTIGANSFNTCCSSSQKCGSTCRTMALASAKLIELFFRLPPCQQQAARFLPESFQLTFPSFLLRVSSAFSFSVAGLFFSSCRSSARFGTAS